MHNVLTICAMTHRMKKNVKAIKIQKEKLLVNQRAVNKRN